MRNTAEAGRDLLGVLTDDELARYGEIARDQAAAELSRWWLQAVLAVAALVALVWSAAKWGIAGIETQRVEVAGFGSAVMLGLAGAFALAWSPYRRVKNWKLWQRHCDAVRAEQERRLTTPHKG